MNELEIKVGDDGLYYQVFNGVIYKLYPGFKYFKQHTYYLHHKVWEFYKSKRKNGYHIHHINGNVNDNRIENLEEIESSEHLSLHAKMRIKDDKDWFESFHKKGIEAAKEWHKSEEGIKWHKEHALKFNFGVFDFGEYNCEVCSDKYKKRTKHQKFCSNKCKSKHRRDLNIDNIEKNCSVCDKIFITNKYSKREKCNRGCKK